MAVESEATTTKLGATPADVSLRNAIPTTTVHSQITTPVGSRAAGRRHALANNQPAAVPVRNGHAVSAIPEIVNPSAWLRRPIVQKMTMQTMSVARAVNAGRASGGIRHHVQF
jgi:hypothetical protein